MDSAAKSRETRNKNTEARTALIREQQAAISAARQALTRVFQAPDATPEQVLEAAKLLKDLGRW